MCACVYIYTQADTHMTVLYGYLSWKSGPPNHIIFFTSSGSDQVQFSLYYFHCTMACFFVLEALMFDKSDNIQLKMENVGPMVRNPNSMPELFLQKESRVFCFCFVVTNGVAFLYNLTWNLLLGLPEPPNSILIQLWYRLPLKSRNTTRIFLKIGSAISGQFIFITCSRPTNNPLFDSLTDISGTRHLHFRDFKGDNAFTWAYQRDAQHSVNSV